MNAIAAVQKALDSTQQLTNWYLGDLSDVDLLVRPVPGANHIAWQFGHLIDAERSIVLSELPSAAYPELPAGFAEKHDTKNAKDDEPNCLARSARPRSPRSRA
jgi:hypothetical protein